ncbi:hypothetical protein AB0F03_37200 [Streptomyces sp. NPDC028722]|uniref:telomere-protecting terminal protein Tpg n=1 Tax=Streptomyces sp. NPDC028722 TaxID=3155016 RepID=UPI0033DA614B
MVKQLKDTRPVADLLGVSQGTVERYANADPPARPDLARCLADAVRARWQPRVRAQARRQAATSTGLVAEVRARFGFIAAPGTTQGSVVLAIGEE